MIWCVFWYSPGAASGHPPMNGPGVLPCISSAQPQSGLSWYHMARQTTHLEQSKHSTRLEITVTNIKRLRGEGLIMLCLAFLNQAPTEVYVKCGTEGWYWLPGKELWIAEQGLAAWLSQPAERQQTCCGWVEYSPAEHQQQPDAHCQNNGASKLFKCLDEWFVV